MENDVPTPPVPPRLSIGFHTAVAVNLVLLLGVAGFLAYDATREAGQREREKVSALDEEAMTLHQAVTRLSHLHSTDEVQQFVDGVCERMTDTASPGHHIVVEMQGKVYQARAHGRDSVETARAVREATRTPGRRGSLQNDVFVVGVHAEDGIRVYVAERLDTIRAEIRAQVVFRAVGVLAFGLILALAVNLTIHRLVARPLRRLVRTIDAIRSGELRTRAGTFKSRELATLATAVNEMRRVLAEDDTRRRSAITHARRVQENLLPKIGQSVPGVTLAAIHRAADGVAGDFYDAFLLHDGSVLMCVADVVGHGIPAAMVAALLKVLILDAAERDSDPGGMIQRVNTRFTSLALPDGFASLLIIRWCANRRTLLYANAGHEPGLVTVRGARPILLPSTGTLIGVATDSEWDTMAIPVEPGSTVVLFTDGVTEAMNSTGQQFGRTRVVRLGAASQVEVGGGGTPTGASTEAVRFDLTASGSVEHKASVAGTSGTTHRNQT